MSNTEDQYAVIDSVYNPSGYMFCQHEPSLSRLWKTHARSNLVTDQFPAPHVHRSEPGSDDQYRPVVAFQLLRVMITGSDHLRKQDGVAFRDRIPGYDSSGKIRHVPVDFFQPAKLISEKPVATIEWE